MTYWDTSAFLKLYVLEADSGLFDEPVARFGQSGLYVVANLHRSSARGAS